MADYYNDALWGYTASGTLGADTLNPGAASGSFDFSTILTEGIRGAAQGAMATMVRGAQQSGQLAVAQAQAIQQRQQSNQLFMLLLIGGVLYLATKKG